MVTESDIEHIAELADIGISRDEVPEFTRQFNAILEYFEILDTVEGESAPAGGITNAFRDDEPRPCLSQEAARICAAAKAGLVGIDCLSVDGYESALPVHRILLNSDVLILEGIDLSAVPAGRYTLICLPLSLGGAEASPVRAVLVRQLPPR